MHALKIKDLTKTYKNGFEALKGVDLTVEAGDFFSLLGPNGAGKSTLINIVTTLLKPTAGEIKIFGIDLQKNQREAKSCIGLVPQEINLFIFENSEQILIQAAGYYGVPQKEAKKRAEKYLKALHLWDKRKTQARMLSGGMKRRLMIARALMHQPKLLILDEPTAGVDIEIRRSMWEFLRAVNEQGTTIILTTHYLEEAENLCRNVAMINHGKIIRHGNMKEFLSDLNVQTYLLEVEQMPENLPEMQQYQLKKVDEQTLEIEVCDSSSLNDIIAELDKSNIVVTSMRNKSSRLEEIFLRLAKQEVADE